MAVSRSKLRTCGCIALATVLLAVVPVRGQAEPPSAAGVPVQESKVLGPPGKSLPGRVKAAAAEGAVGGSLRGTILPLAGVLALVIAGGRGLRWWSRRVGGLRSALGAGGRAPAGILEILGRYPVGRGMSFILLKVDSRILLLSQSAGGRFGAGATFSTLAELSDPEQVASILLRVRDAEGDSLTERFQSMLTRFDRQMDAPAPAAAREVLWDGSRSDIPVIDLTRRSARAAGAKPRRTAIANRPSTGVRA